QSECKYILWAAGFISLDLDVTYSRTTERIEHSHRRQTDTHTHAHAHTSTHTHTHTSLVSPSRHTEDPPNTHAVHTSMHTHTHTHTHTNPRAGEHTSERESHC